MPLAFGHARARRSAALACTRVGARRVGSHPGAAASSPRKCPPKQRLQSGESSEQPRHGCLQGARPAQEPRNLPSAGKRMPRPALGMLRPARVISRRQQGTAGGRSKVAEAAAPGSLSSMGPLASHRFPTGRSSTGKASPTTACPRAFQVGLRFGGWHCEREQDRCRRGRIIY